jgi:hypothetical protein
MVAIKLKRFYLKLLKYPGWAEKLVKIWAGSRRVTPVADRTAK